MALTEAEYKQLIILSVGDDAAGTLAANIDLLWSSHDTYSDLALIAALTKLDAIDLMLGHVRSQVDFRALDGASVNLSDLFNHLLKMREVAQAEVAAAQAVLSGGGAIGELTTTAPILPDTPHGRDPNDRRYRGDPLRPRRGRPV